MFLVKVWKFCNKSFPFTKINHGHWHNKSLEAKCQSWWETQIETNRKWTNQSLLLAHLCHTSNQSHSLFSKNLSFSSFVRCLKIEIFLHVYTIQRIGAYEHLDNMEEKNTLIRWSFPLPSIITCLCQLWRQWKLCVIFTCSKLLL